MVSPLLGRTCSFAYRELTLNLVAVMGGATIYRVPSHARGLGLKEARRLAKAVGRGELPAPG